uniref:FAD-binding domain-containing protein n=1 Tax=Setaria italica TaxID=4555 RepID=K3YVB1_SETIT
MMEEVHGIVIVGGGICGLATALALHRKGIPSLVLEKSKTLRTEGGSIGVHVNGWRVLEQLGVAPELRKTADVVTEFHDVWQQKQGNKSVVVPVRGELRWLKRRDLIETMAKNVPSGAIRFSCHIAAIRPVNPGSHGVVLTTLDGSIIRAKRRSLQVRDRPAGDWVLGPAQLHPGLHPFRQLPVRSAAAAASCRPCRWESGFGITAEDFLFADGYRYTNLISDPINLIYFIMIYIIYFIYSPIF